MAAADDPTSMLGALEAAFDARIARAEDEAASDLAFSLLQDATLAQALQRAGALTVVRPGGRASPAVEIGRDYVVCGPPTAIVPLGKAVFQAVPSGIPPGRSEEPLVARLRMLARAGARIDVSAGGSRHRGRLRRAGRDHIVIAAPDPPLAETPGGHVYVPLVALDEVVVEEGLG